jgi:hypothetical protein
MNKAQEFLELLLSLDKNPQEIPPEEPSRGDRLDIYSSLVNNTNLQKISSPYPNADLVRVKQVFAVLDHNIQEVTYYMKWAYKRVRGIQAVYQSFVWRSGDFPRLRYFPSKIFWGYLFPMVGKLATDKLQTDMGRAFWRSAVGDALAKKVYVYYFNNNTTNPPEQIRDMDDFTKVAKEAWGGGTKFSHRVLVISKDPITKFDPKG